MALGDATNWSAILVCGAAGGLAGGLFSRLLILTTAGLPRPLGAVMRDYPVRFAAFCGLALAVIGFFGGGSTYGTGYEQARALIHGTEGLPILFALMKFAATLISYLSGIPGGVFAPSLAVGAGIGSDIAPLFPLAPVSAIVVLCMVGYFSGVVQAPLTAFVIVLEMTNDRDMVLPLMATALVARFFSGIVCPEPLYKALAQRILRPAESAAPRGT